MTNQIKNFIEEGKNQFYGAYTFRFDDGIENADMIGKAKNVWNWHKQSQISLIKMIVEEYSQIPSYSCNTYSNEGDRILPLMVQKADVDTISSKLKTLIQ